MPDVGVLQLSIQDNSQQAAGGLDQLAGALERVKNAVDFGRKLSSVAQGIEALGRAVEQYISGSTFAKIEDLGKSLESLRGISTVNIKINYAKNGDATSSVRAVRDTLQNISDEAAQAGDNFEPMDHVAQDATNKMDDLANSINDVKNATAGATSEMSQQFEHATALVENYDPQALIQRNKNTLLEHQEQRLQSIASMWDNLSEKEKNYISKEMDIPGLNEMIERLHQVKEIIDTLNRSELKFNWSSAIDQMLGINSGVKSAKDSMSAFMQEMQGDNPMAEQLRQMNPELQELCKEAINTGKGANELTADLVNLDGELKQKKKDAEGASKGIEKLNDATKRWENISSKMTGAFGSLKNSMRKMFPTMDRLMHQFTRLATRMAIRAIIKQVTGAFSEGVENVYRYSQAIGSTFAPQMDEAASSLLMMKNSIGAAVAPLIQSLIPILQTVVNWFIELVNVANQFLAIMNGQATWTRAVKTTATAYDDLKDKTKGSAKAVKELLADWDELNIIQSESGKGQTGQTIADQYADYSKMFEEVSEFDSGIREAADFIKDNMNQIWDIAKETGLAILGWKISSTFAGALSTISSLTTAGIIMDISWKATRMVDNEYMKSGKKGWLVADALINLFGSALAGGIVETVIGGGTGIITAGVELVVSGGISYGVALANPMTDYADSLKTLAKIKGLIGTAALALGFGIVMGGSGVVFGAVTGGLLFALSAAVSVVVEVIGNAEQAAKDAFAKTGEGGMSVGEILAAVQDEFSRQSKGFTLLLNPKTDIPELKKQMDDAFVSIQNLTNIIRSGDALTQDEADQFKKVWTTVFEAFEGITQQNFETLFQGLNESLASENKIIREQAKELRISMLMYENQITEAEAEFRDSMDELADKIARGKASPEEMDQYFAYVDAMAKYMDKSNETIKDIVEKGQRVDYGSVDDMTQFFKDVNASAEEATSTIDLALAAELESIEGLKKTNDLLYTTKQITLEQYNSAQQLLADVEENLRAEAETRKANVQNTTKETIWNALVQSITGFDYLRYDSNGNLNRTAQYTYMLEVLAPIIKAAKEAGVELSDEFVGMFGINVSVQDLLRGFKLNDDGTKVDLSKITEWIDAYYNGELDENFQFKGIEVEVPVDIVPEITDNEMTVTSADIENMIEDYIIFDKLSGSDLYDKIQEMRTKFGAALVDKVLRGYLDEEALAYTFEQLNMDTETSAPTTAFLPKKHNQWAVMPDHGNFTGNGDADISGDMKKGMQEADVMTSADAQNLANVLRMILAKIPTTLTVTPTSSFARTVQMAGSIFGNVTGDTP